MQAKVENETYLPTKVGNFANSAPRGSAVFQVSCLPSSSPCCSCCLPPWLWTLVSLRQARVTTRSQLNVVVRRHYRKQNLSTDAHLARSQEPQRFSSKLATSAWNKKECLHSAIDARQSTHLCQTSKLRFDHGKWISPGRLHFRFR